MTTYGELLAAAVAARADLPVKVRLASGQVRALDGVEFEEEFDSDGNHALTAVVLVAGSE